MGLNRPGFSGGDYPFAAAHTQPGFHDRVRREYVPYMESTVSLFEQRSGELFGREVPLILRPG